MNSPAFAIRASRNWWFVATWLLVGQAGSDRLLAAEPLVAAPAARLAEIQKEVADAEAAMIEAYHALPKTKDEAAADKLSDTFMAKQTAGFAEAMKMAQAAPESEMARDALCWLLVRPQSYHTETFRPGLALLTEHHAADPKIGKGLAVLAYYPPSQSDMGLAETLTLFQKVVDKNPDRAVRGEAEMGLAKIVKEKFEWAHFRGEDSAEKLRLETIRRWDKILREYGDCANLRTRGAQPATAKVEGEAQAELFELRSLQQGQPAPEITGEDLSGVKLKLSDFRGKTTLLVFWASWCGPCMGDVPHERELVARFQDRPFVLIGVNGDDDLNAANIAVKEHEISWRSLWNGKEGPGGPIARAWNVRSWPTVYVIDHKGIIRHKHLRGERLDEPLEKLVAEAEKDAAEKRQ